jgi:hypothetical protein
MPQQWRVLAPLDQPTANLIRFLLCLNVFTEYYAFFGTSMARPSELCTQRTAACLAVPGLPYLHLVHIE